MDMGISNNPTAKAFEVIKQAMIDDGPGMPGSYAHSWHSNIAMMCYDAILADNENAENAHAIGNDAASRFMKLCFGVDTSNQNRTYSSYRCSSCRIL